MRGMLINMIIRRMLWRITNKPVQIWAQTEGKITHFVVGVGTGVLFLG